MKECHWPSKVPIGRQCNWSNQELLRVECFRELYIFNQENSEKWWVGILKSCYVENIISLFSATPVGKIQTSRLELLAVRAIKWWNWLPQKIVDCPSSGFSLFWSEDWSICHFGLFQLYSCIILFHSSTVHPYPCWSNQGQPTMALGGWKKLWILKGKERGKKKHFLCCQWSSIKSILLL